MIFNLTQHAPSPEQRAEGVGDPPAEWLAVANFDDLDTVGEDVAKAVNVAVRLARQSGATRAMIGGAPFLMPPLAAALHDAGVEPIFAFSVRESIEQPQPDGSVRKVAIFRHRGWVPYFVSQSSEERGGFPTAAARNRGGRPPTYDWPAFEAKALERLEYEGGWRPGWRQADLEREMAAWCRANWGQQPAESLIREHVKRSVRAFNASLR
jgi:hypothetical protein